MDKSTFIPYVGNGYFGLALEGKDNRDPDDGHLHVFGRRHLNTKVPFKPVARFAAVNAGQEDRAVVVHYTHGLVHSVKCFGAGAPVSISSIVYAHRTLPGLLVQEVKLTNPGLDAVTIKVDREGLLDWSGAETRTRR